MVVPIILRDELVGVLNVSSRSHKVNYDKTDLKALEVFAENVGSCIRHTEQATWMRQTVQKLQQSLKARNQQAERPVAQTASEPKMTEQKTERNPETGEVVIPVKHSG